MISIIVRVFFMKLLVSQLLNKTGFLRESINIFSMCVVLFFFKQKYQTFSGSIRLNWLFISLIGYPLLFSIINLLMNWSILLSSIFLIYKFLVVWLMLVLSLLEELNWIPEAYNVFSLVINLEQKDMFCMIFTPSLFLWLRVLSFIKIFFLTHSLCHPRTLLLQLMIPIPMILACMIF